MKLWLIAGMAFAAAIASNAALAGTREDILTGAARCSSIRDDRTWLDCYYGAAQPMRAQLGLPPAPQSQTVLVPSVAATTPARSPAPIPTMEQPHRDSGGLFAGLLGGDAVITRVPATAYSFDQHGIFKISLSDGSVWQQVEGDDSFASWREPAGHYLVSIRTGSLGSYNLQVQGDNRSYKVRRVH